jgi:type II secretory pathway pseudopilin PulG
MNQVKNAQARGLSLLVVVIIVALVAVAVIFISAFVKINQARQADGVKEGQLRLIAKAQEFYFDRYHRYANWEELIHTKLLTTILVDPLTLKPYDIYRSNKGDEWCTWTQFESNKDLYFIQSDSGSKTIAFQPTNLVSCKSF